MITYLHGVLRSKSATEVVVDVNGVGYSVNIPLSTFESLPEVNSEVTILTYLHVREDVVQLFGFATEGEREMFRLLISVSGVGPKMAQGILSGVRSDDLRNLIAQENLGALTAIHGIGRKTAERLILELRDKIAKVETISSGEILAESGRDVRAETLMALISLGYTRSDAEKAIRIALHTLGGKNISVQDLLKASLKAQK
jgi:holliday junction DNA helicase RuvA